MTEGSSYAPSRQPAKRPITSGFNDTPHMRRMYDEGNLQGRDIKEAGTQWLELTNSANGLRLVTGKGGGEILFVPDGTVEVSWNHTAALAGSHNTGNRTHSMVKSGRDTDDTSSELDPLFSNVTACRRYHMHDGSQCPAYPNDPTALSFQRIFKRLSGRMLRAVGNGNVDELRAILNHLEKYEQLETGKLELELIPWQRIANAIQEAARELKAVPQKSHVLEKLNSRLAVNFQQSDIRDKLKRMGFGWLPAPRGPRPKAKPKRAE